jgi:hypothetical protein
MKIKINFDYSSQEEVNDALAAVNARVRNATHDDVVKMVIRIEKALTRKGLLKKYWTGLCFQCNPHARVFPNAYKGIPAATYFTVERCPSGWFLVGVERKECRADYITLVGDLNGEQKKAILDVFCKF